MHIGIDLRPLQTGHRFRGIGRYCYNMVKALQEEDSENDYLLLCGRGLGGFKEIKEKFEKDNFKVEQFLIPTNKWLEIVFFKDQLRVPIEVLRGKLDIFYTFDWPFSLPNLPGNSKHIITLYGVNPYPYDKEAETELKKTTKFKEKCSLQGKIKKQIFGINFNLYLKLLKKRIKKVSHVITSSENSKRDVFQFFGIPIHKISVVPEGLDRDLFRVKESKVEIDKIKEKYGIIHPFILFTSAIDWKKNIINVLEAFKIVDNQFRQPHQIVFAGCYINENAKPTQQFLFFKTRAKELRIEDKVIFTGYVPDEHLVLLYNAAEMYILPSFYEGFPLTAIEAMACGTPIIASNTSSMPEIIGKAGIYFDPYDVRNIAQVIVKVCNDSNLRKKIITEGLKQAKKFSWEKSARQIIKVFKTLIGKAK